MIPLWFQRLNRRERVLLVAIGGVIFLLLNLVIWSTLTGMAARARAEMAERKATRMQQKIFLKEQSMWAQRDEWLKKNQPTLKSPVEASALLDQIKQVAGKENMVIENPAIGSGDSTPNYQAVFASVETKSPWPPLVHFLYEVQQPESFVVFESVNLQIDPSDPTMMKGKFKIARWFAPKG
ncbi:MAG: hypothetical protein ABR526_04460 [Chthoniobacterales bacterium]